MEVMNLGNRKGRSTVYNNNLTTDAKMKQVNKKNIDLEEDFLEYLASTDKSPDTIYQYAMSIHIFWCWNLEFNNNKFFVDIAKRDFVKFQNYGLNVLGWSSNRMRTVRATLSSLSNYIENILDDEFPNYKSKIKKIEPPISKQVRDKSVFTEEELTKILDRLIEKGECMKACALSLAMNSGRRRAELTRFKIGFFRPEYTICGGSLYKTPELIKTKGRGADGKLLPLYTLAAPFDPYLNKWIEERHRQGITSQWLFPRMEGNKWVDKPVRVSTLDSWARTFDNVSVELFGKPFYWHALRHYFTTKLLSYDIPSSVVQGVIGWDSADMVNIYDDTDKDERLEKYFGAEGIKRIKPSTLEEL